MKRLNSWLNILITDGGSFGITGTDFFLNGISRGRMRKGRG